MGDSPAAARVKAALDKAHAAQDTLNAFTFVDDEAVEKAGSGGPLAGVPIGLKDLIDQRGRVTTCGSAFYRETAERSAPLVERLEAAGAVIVGRTGLHEWAFGFSSENPHFGPVRNPWDLETSTGGSSGGTAAAVASGITPLGIGTDTGGSVRVPASLCGTYGLKVTHGQIPLDGVFPLVSSVDTVGPLAESVDLLERSYRVMANDAEPTPTLDRSMRIGVPQPWYEDSPTDEVVARGFRHAIEALEGIGHEVHPIVIPGAAPPGKIWDAIAEEVASVHGTWRRQGMPYGDDVGKRIDDAMEVGPEESAAARDWQTTIRSRFADALSTVDLLATPTTPVMRKTIGVDEIAGQHYRAVLAYFTALVNQALLPAIAMPVVGTGLPPVSLQLIGPPGSELALLGFARTLETESIVGFQPAAGRFSSLGQR